MSLPKESNGLFQKTSKQGGVEVEDMEFPGISKK